jgi:asparagine synthase (glutamine-hydrolysing)
MCGIAGIASITGVRLVPDSLKDMCDIMAHRGPDDAGYVFFRPKLGGAGGGIYSRFTDPAFHLQNQHIAPFGGHYFHEQTSRLQYALGMGHRRLAIIDLSVNGHQPMATADRRYWLTFNGEIYNFPELRSMLLQKGHEFQSLGDSEVILRMWEEYGLDCLEQLNGMFALAIYDLRENILTLARDRFGVKPLYYALSPDFFVYASEVKGVLASGHIRSEIDPVSLREYFTFQNIYSDQTLFSGIRLLMPGQVMTLRPGANEPPRIWSFHKGFPGADPALAQDPTIREQVADAFQVAVKRQLISDVEVGAYLSGGMDSGSIVAVAGRSIPRLHTFTCGFDMTNVDGIEQGFDERQNAERLSYLLQTEHYAVVLHSGDMPAALERITWHVDDPRVGMCHQNWYAAKLAGKFVKVCLSGAGGDELFAGYPWRYLMGVTADCQEACEATYFDYWHRLVEQDHLSGLFAPDLRGGPEDARKSFEAIFSDSPPAHRNLNGIEQAVQRILHFEFRTFLHGLFLVEDKISMAHSLEVRVPFLDNDLVDLAFRIPACLKLDLSRLQNKGANTCYLANEGKLVLREAMQTFLPASFTRQPKQGFSPPDDNWYRGESMEYVKAILYDSRTQGRPWFDQKFVKSKLEEHFGGQKNNRLLIWSLLSFEWLQRHFTDSRFGA